MWDKSLCGCGLGRHSPAFIVGTPPSSSGYASSRRLEYGAVALPTRPAALLGQAPRWTRNASGSVAPRATPSNTAAKDASHPATSASVASRTTSPPDAVKTPANPSTGSGWGGCGRVPWKGPGWRPIDSLPSEDGECPPSQLPRHPAEEPAGRGEGGRVLRRHGGAGEGTPQAAIAGGQGVAPGIRRARVRAAGESPRAVGQRAGLHARGSRWWRRRCGTWRCGARRRRRRRRGSSRRA